MRFASATTTARSRLSCRVWACGLIAAAVLWSGPHASHADDLSQPIDPAAAAETIHVPAGFRVELLAAEPLIAGPVAFDWGPDGKFWVAEMIDYPLGLDGQGKPGGRICYLEDTDGDGRFDRRTSFLDGVAFPNGVMAWRDGVLVTAAGEVFFARDTNGDGRADERKTLYSGFNPGNQQHRVNGPRWGMDGCCYLANGDSGGLIESKKTGEKVDIGGRDLRIRPDDGSLETVTGMTQFGRTCDDWGHWFGSNNSNPGFQFVLEDRYLKRNPHIAPPSPKVEVVAPGTLLHPLSVTIERFNEPHSANHYTSACGATIYRDDLLGPGAAGNYFICEPSHNLVERQTLVRDGLEFHGESADPGAHFIRSTDNWFRPVMVRTGPDGALWLADFYRGVLEHPQYIPAELLKKLDLRAGADRGRIYRVVRNDAELRPVPRYSDLDSAELVKQLDSPNGTQRDLIQRTLLWRGDKKAAQPLARLARDAETPVVRAQALWTLDGLDLITEELLLGAFGDSDGAVRAQSLQIAERHLKTMPRLAAKVVAMAYDGGADAQVDVQLATAYLLGEVSVPEAAAKLGKIIHNHSLDPQPYVLAAALSSVNRGNVRLVLAEALSPKNPNPLAVSRLLITAAGVGDQLALADGLTAAATARQKDGKLSEWQFSAVSAALAEFQHRNWSREKILGAELNAKLKTIFAAARDVTQQDSPDFTTRIAAISVLGLTDDRDADLALLAELLTPQNDIAVQDYAIRSLARMPDDRAATALLAHWASFSPALAAQALDVLLSRAEWMSLLLDRLADGTLPASALDATARSRLLEHRDPLVREKAAKLLAAGNSDRQKVVEQFASVLEKSGDSNRGRQVFLKRCAACHRLEGQGFQVGPDLASVGNKTPQSLLVSILDPNRAIEDRFVNYIAVTDDGRQFSGVLAAETGESLTLRGQEGKQQVLLRKDIETLQRTGKSPMPEGLERDITADELADLIAYIAGTSAPVAAGNAPAVIQPVADGSITLPAAAAGIEGPGIRLEEKHANLGYWESPQDVATWSIQLPAAGSYTIDMEYACDSSTAGNSFLLAVAGKELTGQVAATGSWDDYRGARLGRLDLPAGTHKLTFRSAGPLRSALLDLRTIRLLPAGK